MTMDELAVLAGEKCILQLRGVRPFLSDKYPVWEHPNYRYTADYDEKNTFDIEKHLKQTVRLKALDVFEVYRVD